MRVRERRKFDRQGDGHIQRCDVVKGCQYAGESLRDVSLDCLVRARRRYLIVWYLVLVVTRCFPTRSASGVSTRPDNTERRALRAGQDQRKGEHHDEPSLGQYRASRVHHSISAEGLQVSPLAAQGIETERPRLRPAALRQSDKAEARGEA